MTSFPERNADVQAVVPHWPRPLAWLLLMAMLLLLGVGSLAWNAVALVLWPLMPREHGRRIGRKAIAAGYAWYWRVARASGLMRLEVIGLDALADEPGLIVVANHPSLLDAVMLVSRLPRAACVMKASIARNPLFGPGAALARYIRNDSTFHMVRLAVDDLREGGQLLLFPEGTRTTRWPVNPVHSAVGVIAQRAGAPVQVVFIDTDSPFLGKSWSLWRLPPLPIVFTARLGPRLPPPADPVAFQADLEACLAAGVQRTPGTAR